MKALIALLIAFLVSGVSHTLSAQSQEVATSGPEASGLCKRLSAVKHMPFQDEHVDDQVYNQIMAKGSAMTPCLVEQLTNGTKMRDPRSEPTVADFRVGDLAFFLLLRITGVPFEQMLPENVKAKVKEEGVYAYFRYTEVPANRAALQRKWKAWLKAQASQPKAG
jgi:hypothetical protein